LVRRALVRAQRHGIASGRRRGLNPAVMQARFGYQQLRPRGIDVVPLGRRLGASSAAAHYGSPPRYLGASSDACAPRYPRVRSCRSAEATGTPLQTGASGYEKMPSTCPRLRVDQLLERTWVSYTDQAPTNAKMSRRLPSGSKAPAASRQEMLDIIVAGRCRATAIGGRTITMRGKRSEPVATEATHPVRQLSVRDRDVSRPCRDYESRHTLRPQDRTRRR
jgi:hypothetical protein